MRRIMVALTAALLLASLATSSALAAGRFTWVDPDEITIINCLGKSITVRVGYVCLP